MAKEISITVTEGNRDLLTSYFSALLCDLSDKIDACDDKLSDLENGGAMHQQILKYKEILSLRMAAIDDMRYQLLY